jgi:hypothetical protein
METVKNLGRPTKLNKTTVQKLIDGFRLGMNVSQVCTHAKISRSSFYTYLQDNPEFSDKIEYEKSHLLLRARSIVSQALEAGDLKTAKWYLEKFDISNNEVQLTMRYEKSNQELTVNEKISRLENVLRAYKKEGEFATTEIDPQALIA